MATNRPGLRVRQAVEVLIQALDEADRARGRKLLKGVPEADVYEAAVTVIMRLVFLVAAEERGLLADPLSNRSFSVSTLVFPAKELSAKLDRRNDAWMRLLAPLAIDNRSVVSLLESLQPVAGRGGTGEYGSHPLNAEQIGHVYEGLLDRTVLRATDHMLGLVGSRGIDPAIELSRLERLRKKGKPELLKFLKETTGRSHTALRSAWEMPLEDGDKKLKAACGTDKKLFNRVRPFAGLMRNDSTGRPVLIRAGNLFVTVGTNRRSTGSHYTPVKLTEPIVRHTLEPLVYESPAEGLPTKKSTLHSARQLLDLKICDMACGAGAFLVQACRYLSERLLEAWENAEKEHPGVPGVLPYGEASTGVPQEVLIPAAIDARRIEARRIVAARCLYGVDKNPLSIEVAKLSLGLLTLSKDKPFAFLDHCLRCGDSLVGISRVEQIQHLSLQPDNDERDERRDRFAAKEIEGRLNAVKPLRRAIQEQPSDTPEDIERKQAMLMDAEEQTRHLRDAADLLVATNWPPAPQSEEETHEPRNRVGIPAQLHWPLEFPEVFLQRDGFDAVLGNPPFINAIEGGLSAGYKAWLASRPHHLTGTADLAFHFLAQADHLTRPQGAVGLLMPRPFLNAKAGSQLRLKLLTSRAPAVLFSPEDSSAFAFANVKVVAVILFNRSDGSCTSLVQGKPQAIDIRSENWWSALAGSGYPSRAKTCCNVPRVADVFEVSASMTAGNAYDLKPIVHDRADTSWPRLVTTGLIDPGKCLWGEVACRYLKSIYGHPVICPFDRSSADLKKRLRTATRPKILVAGVAGPGGGLEAFVDERGVTCGAVSTYTITHPADSIPALQSLCDFLNSPAVTALVFTELHASSMGSGLLTIKKAFLSNLCLPARAEIRLGEASALSTHHQVIPEGFI